MNVKSGCQVPARLATGTLRSIEKLLVFPLPVVGVQPEFVIITTARRIIGGLVQIYKLKHANFVIYTIS